MVLSGASAAGCSVDMQADCPRAAERVEACYGPEIAEQFSSTCDEASAGSALEADCPGSSEGVAGKTDLFPTDILSPPLEQFKYGSIGADKRGIPLAILRAVPVVCEDTLPPGADPYIEPLASFGLIYEPGHEVPIGFSSRRLPLIGITLVGNTCSVCHTSTVRETPESDREVYFGAPATRFDIEGYNNFLLDCISDPARFNPSNVSRAFNELDIRGADRLLALSTGVLRWYIQDLREQVASVVRDGPWGPGRDDAIGLSGAILVGEVPTIAGPVDFPSVWNQDARAGQALHWDGAAGSPFERNVLVSVGAGTPRNGVPFESIDAIQGWLEENEAPPYPFFIDRDLAAQGQALFSERCATCHAEEGPRLWEVVDLEEIGTDPNRADAVTEEGAASINALSGRGWDFEGFRSTNGYLNSLLDGIWLRAPYLHNGSVPTLRDLLRPAGERPAVFYRGNDVYDQENVGFVSTVASEGGVPFSLFDTTRSGNGNQGHEYGTELSEAEIDALVEYMKLL
ncbi:MAG: cytochrome c [Myxococcota bacterium]